MNTTRTAALAFAAGRLAFGAALIAVPDKVGASWLGSDAERRPAQVALRGLGARDIALSAGVVLAAQTGGAMRPWLAGALACDLADIGSTLAAGDSIPSRGRWGTVALAGVAAAAGAALLAAVDE